jgi:hypothetical protein
VQLLSPRCIANRQVSVPTSPPRCGNRNSPLSQSDGVVLGHTSEHEHHAPTRPHQWPPVLPHDFSKSWAWIAQSVQRLARRYTVCGYNPGGGRDFPHLSIPALVLTQPPLQLVLVLFPVGKGEGGLKRPEYGFEHPPPSGAKVIKIVEQYLYSPSGPLWLVLE